MHFYALLGLKHNSDTYRCNIHALLCTFGTLNKFLKAADMHFHALLGLRNFLHIHVCTSVHFLDLKQISNGSIHALLCTSWTLKLCWYSDRLNRPFATIPRIQFCASFRGWRESWGSTDAGKATWIIMAMHVFEVCEHHRLNWVLSP